MWSQFARLFMHWFIVCEKLHAHLYQVGSKRMLGLVLALYYIPVELITHKMLMNH